LIKTEIPVFYHGRNQVFPKVLTDDWFNKAGQRKAGLAGGRGRRKT
jgi:hypothetical protein